MIAWDIASNTIPFITNGLSGADKFELALYSMVFQGDSYLNYLSNRNPVFADAGNITAENMHKLSQYCYIYLKSCYVTREAALASLESKSSSTKAKIQPLIDYQNSINTEIAKIMVNLKGSNKSNEGCMFGFLPSDNKNYISKYSDSHLIQWIHASEKYIDGENFEDNTINLYKTWETFLFSREEKPVYFIPADYDGDGVQEAFGISGFFDGEMLYCDVKIYYINSFGDISCVRESTKYGDRLYGYLLPQSHDTTDTVDNFLISTSTSKFMVWEVSAGGSGSSSIILGVKGGKAYEPAISDQYIVFHQNDLSEFIGLTSDFSKGFHDYIENVFIYDKNTGEFILQ